MLLVLQTALIGPSLEVRPISPVEGNYVNTLGSGPTVRGRARELKRCVHRKLVHRHAPEQGGTLRLGLASLLGLTELDVWPETAGLAVHG